MTRYSRSVIPGRQLGDNSGDIDRLVFGKRTTPPANDADDDMADVSEGEAAMLVERAASDRRRGKRRQSDFTPLPGEARFRTQPEGSKRGPLLLIGALVIVAVFGVVVWNAYRDGVRPGDASTAPQLAAAGPFKSKPAEDAVESKFARPDYSATVFEQVESPKPTVQPAPEVRAEAAAPPPPKPAATPPVQTAAAAPKPATPAPAVKPPTNPSPAPLQVAAATSAPAAPAEPALAGAYKPAFSPAGNYLVQIAAPSTEQGAVSEWARKAKAAPELFGTAERFIVQADVNGRTVYRLRAGSFATAADADAFCDAYKAKGGACFRTTK
jgi:hypothetical protein